MSADEVRVVRSEMAACGDSTGTGTTSDDAAAGAAAGAAP